MLLSALFRPATLVAFLLIPSLPAEAQSSGESIRGASIPGDSVRSRFLAEAETMLQRPDVQRAVQHLASSDSATLRHQRELTEIPAPPFHEQARAREFLRRLTLAGADTVWLDREGNALGLRQGTVGSRTVVISGHLDTVFPAGTDVRVRMRGDTLRAPGIADDGRGLAVILAVLGALHEVDIRTRDHLLVVGTVGEEGLGDLRGVKHLFRSGASPIHAFLSVDGSGFHGVTNGALGSVRYRVTVRGPGGHSWGDFGMAHPAHALARAVTELDDEARRFTASAPPSSYSVGRMGGGRSVNAIPDEVWMEVDLRSESQAHLMALDSVLHRAVRGAVEEENRTRRSGSPLEAHMDRIGLRPSGMVSPATPFVQRAMAATILLGGDPVPGISSTDANVPISLGVPAVTLGGGGDGGGAHSLDEWYVDRDGFRGAQRVFLLAVLEAGLP
ncbi:MAG: M20/M25/M40 family metallo-hydrolase [Gemmatimonadota bacterium]